MSARTREIQIPSEVTYLECDRCHTTGERETVAGWVQISMYRQCDGEGNQPNTILGVIQQIASHGTGTNPLPHFHQDETQHLCAACAELFTKFVQTAPDVVPVAVPPPTQLGGVA